jgi:hypothetical protein
MQEGFIHKVDGGVDYGQPKPAGGEFSKAIENIGQNNPAVAEGLSRLDPNKLEILDRKLNFEGASLEVFKVVSEKHRVLIQDLLAQYANAGEESEKQGIAEELARLATK